MKQIDHRLSIHKLRRCSQIFLTFFYSNFDELRTFLKVVIKVFFVVMATYYAKKMTKSCSPVIKIMHLCDNNVVASLHKEL